MKQIRFVLFNVVAWGAILIYCPAVLIARLFGHRPAFTVAQNWAQLALKCAKFFCGLDYRIEGRENFPDEACVVFIKHSSALETVVQLAEFPLQSWVLKRELIWVPFFGWGLAALNPIAIDRSKGRAAVKQVLDQGRERLAKGLYVMIFPEGTRMRAGTTRRYGISGTLLAQENRKVILPIAHNAGYHWPRRGWEIKSGTVTFVIGKPFDPAGREPREFNAELQRWMEAEVEQIVARDTTAA
jgi:1-acyl-sn-glycerol-3-phosphate acyltransferase